MLSLLSLVAGASGVTITTNGQSASTTVAGLTDSTPPTTQALPNNGSISAIAGALGQTDLGGGSWQFNGTTLGNLSASRGGTGANTDVVASAQILYQIVFTLGVGESADVILDLGYSLSEVGINGTLNWNLNGPGGAVTAISGNVGSSATNESLLNQTISQQQASLTSAGTYTFSLTGAMPSQTTNKSQSVSLAINSVDFRINATAVPEPASAVFGALGAGALLLRRRRRNLA